MASPVTIDKVLVGRLLASCLGIQKDLMHHDTFSLPEAQDLELQVSYLHKAIVYAIKKVTEPQHDAPGISNDTHGMDSRRNPEHI